MSDYLSDDDFIRFSQLEFQFLLFNGNPVEALTLRGIDLNDAQRQLVKKRMDEARTIFERHVSLMKRQLSMHTLEQVVAPNTLHQMMGSPCDFTGCRVLLPPKVEEQQPSDNDHKEDVQEARSPKAIQLIIDAFRKKASNNQLREFAAELRKFADDLEKEVADIPESAETTP